MPRRGNATAWILTLLAWLLAVLILAPVCFFLVILLAGPHSTMLPAFLQPLVLLLGWIVFFMGPVWVARVVWRRLARAPVRS
jgi:hypothetical protein